MAAFKESYGFVLDISPIGYEATLTEIDNDWDANWLMMMIHVEANDLAWSSSGPSLLTWELLKLAEWVDDLSQKAEEGRSFSTLEGDIGLTGEKAGNSVKLAIRLDRRFLPLPLPDGSVAQEPMTLKCVPSLREMHAFAEQIRSDLARFPVRVVEKEGVASQYRGRL